MGFPANSIYHLGTGLMLMMGLGFTADARAQQSPSGFRNRLDNIWNRIVRDDEHRQPPQSSRGEMCAIAPAVSGPIAEIETIWHDQPIVVLDPGTIAKVSLKTEVAEKPFWSYEPTADENHVRYDGDPLAPGQTYVLRLHSLINGGPAVSSKFEVLPAASRTLIENGLKIATDKHDPALIELPDIEQQAIQRADYFANRGLPYDAIQALFSVSSPSAELSNRQADILEESCTSNLAVEQGENDER